MAEESTSTNSSVEAVWVLRPLAYAAIAFTLIAFGLHTWAALTSYAYRSFVGGVFLALARDLGDGIFYRDLISPVGYGGTRYFPLFFTLLGLFMRLGVAPLVAGAVISVISGGSVATGLYAICRRLDVPRTAAVVFAAAGLAPYFIQQTLFEVRSDVLAAGLNLWGIALILRAWRMPEGARASMLGAALVFTLAAATKITSLAAPAALVAALVVTRKFDLAWRLASTIIAGVGVMVIATAWLSDGRAITSWRTCLFAGTTSGQTLGTVFSGAFVGTVGYSHLLTALFVLDLAALTIVARQIVRSTEENSRRVSQFGWLLILLFLGVSGATAFTLSSPGTVPSNQVVEWIEISLVLFAGVTVVTPRLARGVMVLVAALTLWAAAQDIVRARALSHATDVGMSREVRQHVIDRLAQSKGPVLSESPLWPVLAGQRAYTVDPFALRVVMLARPDIRDDLLAKLDARVFQLIVLQFDPSSSRGRTWYEHVNFGSDVIARVVANYRLEGQPAADVWLYVPNSR